MRLVACLVLLAGCGDIIENIPDAPKDIDAAVADAPPSDVPRLYALSAINFGQPSTMSLEMIDLRTNTRIRDFPVGFGIASALAVSPDGRTAYVATTEAGEIGVYDTTTGVAGIPIPGVAARDLVLSADGSKLYATQGTNVVAIDTATRSITPSPAFGGNRLPLSIALSPDGQRLAVGTLDGGSASYVTLVRTSDMSIETQ